MNRKVLKYFFIFLLVLGSGFLGYSFSRRGSLLPSKSESRDPASMGKTEGAQHHILEKPVDQSSLSAVEKALDQLPLTPKEQELSQNLGNDSVGIKLRRAFLASFHKGDLAGSSLYEDQFVEDLAKDPVSSAATLKTGLSRLPTNGDFAIEKTALLSRLDVLYESNPNKVSRTEVKNLAFKELMANIAPERVVPEKAANETELNESLSTTPAMVLAATAYEVYIGKIDQPQEAIEGTLAAMKAQRDYAVRNSMAGQFLLKYPQMQNQLKTLTKSHGISLPMDDIIAANKTVVAQNGPDSSDSSRDAQKPGVRDDK